MFTNLPFWRGNGAAPTGMGAGTYTYFYRLHPFLTGTVTVKP